MISKCISFGFGDIGYDVTWYLNDFMIYIYIYMYCRCFYLSNMIIIFTDHWWYAPRSPPTMTNTVPPTFIPATFGEFFLELLLCDIYSKYLVTQFQYFDL